MSTLRPGFDLGALGPALARLGPVKLGAMAAVAAAAILAVVLVARAPQATNGLLYAGLEPSEAGRIVARLEEMKVPVEARGDGTVLVPAEQVARLRMQLAGEGLPRQGGAGYELLDQANPMQMTSFMQRIQRVRALEGELARTIITMQGVRSARVHIVLPERESFSRDAPPPTASVTVITATGQRLGASQASAIRLLVAGAVPRLRQEDVSVVDPSGIVLAADGGSGAVAGRIGELRQAQEQALRQAVLDLLEPIVGRGRVRTVAAVEIEGARTVARAETYDPMGQVERGRQSQTEAESSEDGRGQQPVTVGQNLPNQQTGGTAQRSASTAQRSNETINYEISSKVEETTREPGAVKRVSIAVVVDGVTGPDGEVQERPREELERLAALVRSAVGFDEKRGDRVTVDTLRFIPDEGAGSLASADDPGGWRMSNAQLLVAGLLLVGSLGTILFLLRRRSRLRRLAAALAVADAAAAEAAMALDPMEEAIATVGQDIQIRISSLNALNELIDTRPEEALSVVRAWIQEGAPA
ncbi:flagellar M-ring protein FliF (plasmid) [Roseomonas marmotae]|uniref:Flagellar M-ring protein n=1 Tax=Roseomonas marmotae TaxID=2768161 RepID=A0ABS3KF09_9PROT|nr:flagellar basal-body MS-ring/collar protein FliF [Roseomonas marmotae]MBO1076057.1 flagellar M-ring protein FliF [Roseomonas marmotae]QTI81296.1 flagellar M-ring protein FliF [Roseomonas marmotae]